MAGFFVLPHASPCSYSLGRVVRAAGDDVRVGRTGATVLEERVLQQRVDLVCRDLVGSYRDLAERFVGFRDTATRTPD